MENNKEEVVLAIKSMTYAQAFVDTLDQMRGTNAFRQGLKHKAKKFNAEVEKFLDTAYCGGDTESTLLELLERCQNTIDEIIEKEVEFVNE